MGKFCVHWGTSCKISDPTDKDCGNESKIRLTSKNSLFYAPSFTFQINDQKTREFKQLWETVCLFKKKSAMRDS